MQIKGVNSNKYKCAFSGHSFTITPEVAKTIREMRKSPTSGHGGVLAELRDALNYKFWDNPFDEILNVHITKIKQEPNFGAVVDLFLHTKKDRIITSSLILTNKLDVYDAHSKKMDDFAARTLLKHERQKEPFWITMRAKFVQNKMMQTSHYEFEPRDPEID